MPEGSVVLSVADNGCGMSQAFLKDSLFRPFQSTKKKGLGIGLFQSRAIVQAHGGGMQVESEVGQRHDVSRELSGQGREMTKPTLLIVDDDEDIRTQMKWALRDGLRSGDGRGPRRSGGRVHGQPSLGDAARSRAAAASQRSRGGAGDALFAARVGSAGQGDHRLRPGRQAERAACRRGRRLRFSVQARGHGRAQARAAALRSIVAELEQEYRAMQQSRRAEAFEDMLGASPQMQSVFDFIRKVAPTTAPVLILGESGTGKEMVAQALHRRSPQKNGPFIAINCNAIPENLLESELFGHEKGAFTGAHTQRKGHIESAAGGTLFLDEIGELPASVQVKLLRFLQEKRFQRVGGRQEIQSDARVIAATNMNLQESGREREVSRGPLLSAGRRRRQGAPAAGAGRRHRPAGEGVPAPLWRPSTASPSLTFAPDALRALNLHRWPGNVRELQNRVQRAVIMADGKRVTASDLELTDALSGLPPQTLKEARESVEREMVQDALRRHSGKITSAALELGISRPTLYELMEKLGIAKEC